MADSKPPSGQSLSLENHLMLITAAENNHDPGVPASMTSRRKLVFAFCLFFSLAVHATTALLVLFSSSASRPVALTHYIDLAATPLPAAPSEIHAPVPNVAEQTVTPPEIQQPKEEGPVESSAAPGPVTPEILSTPLGLGLTHGFFKSLGEGKTLRDEIRVYYFEILEKINTAWWQKAGNLSATADQDGIVDISIGPDGVLIGVQMARTTGSGEVDRAIIEALREASPFAPPPVGFGQDVFRAPLRIAAPSNLFRLEKNP